MTVLYGIAWPFWIGVIMMLGGAAVLVREYLRRIKHGLGAVVHGTHC